MQMRRINSKGFSLVEMMVVICLFTILIVIAIPNYNTFRAGQSCAGAAYEFEGEFKKLRQRVLTNELPGSIVYNSGPKTYDVFQTRPDTSRIYYRKDVNVGKNYPGANPDFGSATTITINPSNSPTSTVTGSCAPSSGAPGPDYWTIRFFNDPSHNYWRIRLYTDGNSKTDRL
jgi:prepilin-type N-terminal cleavage/methylation domain-containing protein